MPKQKITPENISKLVETKRDHTAFSDLRSRWEQDYEYYTLNQYDAGEGYQSYTTNKPRTMTDKIISYLSEAIMVVRTTFNAKDADSRKSGVAFEKFVRGCIRMANDRLTSLMHPHLQNQIAFYIGTRGWFAGKAMFNKQDEQVMCEIDVWDPMHTTWDTGDMGLNWIAYSRYRSSSAIYNMYGVDFSEQSAEIEEEDIEVIEYIDKEIRCVVAHDQYLVKPVEHKVTDGFGNPQCPGFVGFVGPSPMVQGKDDKSTSMEFVGESVLGQVRNLIDVHNKSMSDWMTLVRRAVKHPLILRSRDGRLRLMDDPYKEGTNIQLKEGENIELAPEMKLIADAGQFMGLVNSDFQQGTLPDVVFGDIKFQLSGHAANILRSGASHQILHRLEALGNAFYQIGQLLRWQYQSGRYGTVQFRGQMEELKEFYDEEVSPEDIQKAGHLAVEFKNSLGLEDPARFSTAQMLREGPTPMAPDSYIWDKILDVEDPDAFKKEIFAQQAQYAEPKATAFAMWEGLTDTGQEVEAQFYLEQIKRILLNERRSDELAKLEFQIQMLQGMLTLQQANMPPEQQGMGMQGAPPQQGGPPMPPQGAGQQGSVLNMNNGVVPGAGIGLDLMRGTTPPNNTRAPGEPRPGAGGI